MVQEPQLLQVAAGIDFDTIAPFVFVFLIVVSQIMGALKRKGGQKDEEPDVDAIERARQIREEIRRKIEQRRQEMEPGTTRPVDRPRRPVYDPTRQESQQRPVVQGTSPARPVSRPAQPEQNRRQPSLEERLTEQRQKLEVARRHQKEAEARARRMLQESGAERRVRENQSWAIGINTNKLQKDLLSGLRDKNGIRKAVLYREILDKPIGLR